MRWLRRSLLVLVVGATVGVVAAPARRPKAVRPGPVVVEGPADFQAVVEGAVTNMRQGLPAASGCVEGLTIRPDWDLDDRARYHQGIIDVRVPATAPRIEEVVVHEVAHHLDATCDVVDPLRDAFLASQGLPPPWDLGPSWEETPAEQFAEAVTLVVLGRQRAHNVRVSAESVDLVRRWGTATG